MPDSIYASIKFVCLRTEEAVCVKKLFKNSLYQKMVPALLLY